MLSTHREGEISAGTGGGRARHGPVSGSNGHSVRWIDSGRSGTGARGAGRGCAHREGCTTY